MPITQDRMLTLIKEGEKLLSEYKSLRLQCENLISEVRAGRPPSDALSILETFLLLNPPVQPLHLHLEARHFGKESGTNRKRAEQERRKREAKGLPKKNTGPTSLLSPLTAEETENELQKSYLEWLSNEET